MGSLKCYQLISAHREVQDLLPQGAVSNGYGPRI